MIGVNSLQIMRADVPHIIDCEQRCLTKLMLEPDVHLNRTRGLEVGREQSALIAQDIAEKIWV